MENKNYANFITDQLAGDRDFQRWVFSPTPDDLRFWETFLLTYPDQLEKVNMARQLVQAAHGLAPEEKLTAVRKKELHDQLMKSVSRENKRTKVRTWSFSMAAAVLLLIVAGILFWQNVDKRRNGFVVENTEYGQKKEIVLPDGSTVVLRANSTLTYPKNWNKGDDRQVWLKGEAHFTVTPQPATQAKFTVITNDLNVNVLGTVFNVHARNQGTRVTLEEGKVTLQLRERTSEGTNIVMEPGEQVLFSARTQELMIEEEVDVEAQHSWKNDLITFDGITLGRLGETIEETFGKRVIFRDSTMSRQQLLSGTGPADDLDLLLEIVEKLKLGIRIAQQDSVLIFEKE